MDDLGPIAVVRKTGRETFRSNDKDLGFDLLDFWRWSVSDLVSNATRGRLAEYIVARAIGVDTSGIRSEWDAFDLKTRSGITIEVKSAAYLQTWRQKKHSNIIFSVRKTRAWDAQSGELAVESVRQSQIYVFALLAHQAKHSLDPLNVEQWSFYVVPTIFLDGRTRSQHTITLKSLETLTKAVQFSDLAAAVGKAAL